MALLKEPLFQFVLIGSLIFSVYTMVSPPRQAPKNLIVIGSKQIEQLIGNYRKTWRQEPDETAIAAMVEDAVREEVYYREALALGLDHNDTVIRLRLRQKMEFLSDTGADLLDPDGSELNAYLAANQEAYAQPAKIALEQVFLGKIIAPPQIITIAEHLKSNTPANPYQWQKASLLPAQLPLSSPQTIDGIFGAGFFNAAEKLPLNQWSTPIESSFGMHLVRVTQFQAEKVPELAEIRPLVLRDWKAKKTLELRQQLFAKLRDQYQIQLPASLSQSLADN
ncbi:MAG: peptidyl-prolyl cis-trans isomerase [Porticoccaceae bacterium]